MTDLEDIEVIELIGSPYKIDRTGKTTTWQQKYLIQGTDDKDEAANALLSAVI